MEARGAWFLSLTSYWPDLNPIQQTFTKLEAHSRAGEARSYDALWRGISNICNLFDPGDCRNFCKHAGYNHE